MKFTPVDASRVQVVVVGVPKPQMRDGVQQTDRDTGVPMWNIDIAVISDFRVEAFPLGVPEGGFPKELGIGAVVNPEDWVSIEWGENQAKHGTFHKAKSVKVPGGSAAAKGAAA